MNTLLIIVGIIAAFWIIGKMIWMSQDKREIELNPNHPVKLSKKLFPVGSGNCPVRNNDRHIWDYGNFDESMGPTTRTCKHCGKQEYRMIVSNKWDSFY